MLFDVIPRGKYHQMFGRDPACDEKMDPIQISGFVKRRCVKI